MNGKSILAEADAVAGHDRSRDYGHPYENHERIAAIWNVQLGPKLSRPIEPREVALMMVGLKLAREVNTPKRDNLVDAAGYIKCVDMIDERSREHAPAQTPQRGETAPEALPHSVSCPGSTGETIWRVG